MVMYLKEILGDLELYQKKKTTTKNNVRCSKVLVSSGICMNQSTESTNEGWTLSNFQRTNTVSMKLIQLGFLKTRYSFICTKYSKKKIITVSAVCLSFQKKEFIFNEFAQQWLYTFIYLLYCRGTQVCYGICLNLQPLSSAMNWTI